MTELYVFHVCAECTVICPPLRGCCFPGSISGCTLVANRVIGGLFEDTASWFRRCYLSCSVVQKLRLWLVSHEYFSRFQGHHLFGEESKFQLLDTPQWNLPSWILLCLHQEWFLSPPHLCTTNTGLFLVWASVSYLHSGPKQHES